MHHTIQIIRFARCSRSFAVLLIGLVACGLLAAGCGSPMTPEQELAFIRGKHEIQPTGYTVQWPEGQAPGDLAVPDIDGETAPEPGDGDGDETATPEPAPEPTLVVDLLVTNTGRDTLPQLSVLVEVVDATGSTVGSHPAVLDLSGIGPGTPVQTAIELPGVSIPDGGGLQVVVETGLSDEELRALPEFAAIGNTR